MTAYFVNFAILAMALLGSMTAADVAHLGYSRYTRPSAIRLQRLEGNPTPYPASGYRPNREFNLPREQPLFPLSNQVPQGNKQVPQDNNNNNNGNNDNNNSFGFDNQSEPQQPQLTYGAPARLRQQATQQRQQQQQQLQQLQQQQLKQQQLQQQQLQQKQQQFLLQQQQQEQQQSLFQQPQSQPQNPQFFNAPPQLYAAPQAERLTQQPKPARLTETREDSEDEDDNKSVDTADASMEIETVNKTTSNTQKTVAPQSVATIAYYPAGAFSFVQPISAAYVSAVPSIYQSPYVTPAAAAAVATSPYVQQPLTFGAAPAQLQAW